MFKPREIPKCRWNCAGQGVVGKSKESETSQPSQVRRDGACKLCVGQVEEREEGEVTKARGERSLERHVLQHESGDTRPAAAARHADPVAEGSVKRPLIREDLKVIQYQSQEADNTFITSDGTSPYNSARKWAVKRYYREDNN